jgi:GntR family transcriptional regulator, transcriptional repressor for pyruvate dehydrogenase complex
MDKNGTPKSETQVATRVVDYIRGQIESQALKPGDCIPPEREFARDLKVSRASLRAGIGFLAAMGILKVRHGVGTFVADNPAAVQSSWLNLWSAVNGLKPSHLYEARLVLEGTLASLAAKRGREEHLLELAEEVGEMYATFEEPEEYLIHDVRFHRTIAEAAGNPILKTLMEAVTATIYERRRGATPLPSSLRSSAELHKEIYRAIRSRNAGKAKELMECHLRLAEDLENQEQGVNSKKTRSKRSRHGKLQKSRG